MVWFYELLARENMFTVKEILSLRSEILLLSSYIYRNAMDEVLLDNILHVLTEGEEVSKQPFLFPFADMEGTAGVSTLYLIKKPAEKRNALEHGWHNSSKQPFNQPEPPSASWLAPWEEIWNS